MAVNRIKLSPESHVSTATSLPTSGETTQLFEPTESAHSIFVPIHYEPNYNYPLVVWLHSEWHDQQQLQQIMPLVSVRNFVAVGPCGTVAGADGKPGFDWWQSEKDIDQAEAGILDAVESAQRRYSIASERVFIAGFSHGGTMALRIGLRHPETFAGAVTIGGAFPRKHRPLKNLLQSRSLPLLIAQGRDAEGYCVEQTCDDLRLLHAGGFNVTLRQYPCGQELTTQMLSDMNTWIMEQVTGTSPASPSEPSMKPGELN